MSTQFGATLRLLRLDAGLSVRALAERVGVSGAYLSRVENGHDGVPTPDRLAAIAGALGLPETVLVQLADQVGPFVARYVRRVPAAASLFLEIARRDLGDAQLAAVRELVSRRFPAASAAPAPRTVPLGALLSTNRVVVQLSCEDLEDAIDVAAARLARHAGARARLLAARILAREREASTAVGNGFGVPHALIPGAPLEAALVTLAQPLPAPTPDGRPLRVLVVLVGAGGGPPFLDVLAQVARLARSDSAEALCRARDPRRLLARLAQQEDPPSTARS
jgi:PTS system nitrogen regulatory IIA component